MQDYSLVKTVRRFLNYLSSTELNMALRTLYQAFLHSDMGRLRIIALQWGLNTMVVRHTDLAAALVEVILNAEAVTAMLSKLPDHYRNALDDLLRHDGNMPWSSFLRRWGPLRDIGMGKMEREELWREPQSAVEALWLLGIVQRDFTENPSNPIEMAYVPEQLSLYMPVPAPFVVPPPQPVSIVEEHSDYKINDSFAEDLVTWWISIQRASEMTPTGFLKQLHDPAALRAIIIETISLEQGWVRKDQSQELRMVPEPVLNWLRADLWTQWSSLARAWVGSMQWRDVDHIQSLYHDPVHDWSPNPLQTRRRALDLLPQCSPDNWYSVSDFTAYIKEHATDFMRPDGNYDRWAPREIHTDRPLRGFESWMAVEGAYIRFIITGPLYWLGIIDLDIQEVGSQKVRFRLTHAGAALLGLCDPPQIVEPHKLTIDSTAVIDVPPRRRYERYQLSRVAQLVYPDNVNRFRLTPSSLKRAQQQHIKLSRIVSFLEQASGHPVSAGLRIAMENLYRGNEGASLEHQWILRLPDPKHATVAALQNMALERLTPSIFVVGERDLERVLAILSENGILVDVHKM